MNPLGFESFSFVAHLTTSRTDRPCPVLSDVKLQLQGIAV